MFGAKVRLRYAGFVSFSSMLFSVLTGLAFTIIVTRKLSSLDFGLWQVISITVAYFVMTINIVRYWAPRFIARGENVARSTLIFSLATGMLATAGYIVLSNFLCQSLRLDFFYFLVFSPHVFLSYVSVALEGVSQGYAPQYIGYSFLLFETIKVAAAYLIVVIGGWRLLGALVAVMVAQLAKMVYLIAATFPMVRESSFEFEHVKRYLRLAWIPLYYQLTEFIGAVDVYIVVYFAGSTLPVAMFRVAQVLATTVLYSSAFSQALYPRILAKKSSGDIEETLRLTFMFAFPMSVGLVVMAPSLLCIFGVKYLSASAVLPVMAFALFLASLTRVLEVVILGTEEVDAREKASFSEYLKSRLFVFPTAKSLFQCVYLAILVVFLVLRLADIALLWAAAFALGKALFLAWEYVYSKKIIDYRVPLGSAFKYLSASLVMGVVLFLLGAGSVIEVRIMDLIPKLLVYIALGAAVYFVLVLAVDNYARGLAFRAWRLARGRLAGFLCLK